MPAPVPVEHNITLSLGTVIPVRITQTLDSATSKAGDTFTGAIATDLIMDGMVVLPQGTPVTGHVDAVQDAAHYKGSSLLTLSLSSINRKGGRIEVSTESFTKQGEGRGKNTAEKIGGGAAVGAFWAAFWAAAREQPSARRRAAALVRERTLLPAASRCRSPPRRSYASACSTPSSFA